eukprot:114262-Chlamydomonas_euryale.AAC.1
MQVWGVRGEGAPAGWQRLGPAASAGCAASETHRRGHEHAHMHAISICGRMHSSCNPITASPHARMHAAPMASTHACHTYRIHTRMPYLSHSHTHATPIAFTHACHTYGRRALATPARVAAAGSRPRHWQKLLQPRGGAAHTPMPERTHRWQRHMWQRHRWQQHRWQRHRWQRHRWQRHRWQRHRRQRIRAMAEDKGCRRG